MSDYPNLPPAYQNLHSRMREAALIHSTASVLHWDLEAYQPPQGSAWRGEQLAWLSGQAHRLTTAPEVEAWLHACEDAGLEAGSVAEVNVREWRRDYDRNAKLPAELVEEFSRVTSTAHAVWAEARQESDFRKFQPVLEKIVELNQRKADAWGWNTCRYDALMDVYEPGANSADIAQLFSELGPQLRELIGPAAERSARVPADLLAGHYPVAAQQAFNAEVLAAIGFDTTAGRVDTALHPFCTSLGPRDTRLTTRYSEENFLESLSGVLHEAGHGLYEQGLLAAEWGLPMGEAVSLGIHESQSRLWENHIGGSVLFWEKWLPAALKHFPNLAGHTPEQLTAAAARVQPGFIRVEADEVTYDQHVILRFEIEREIINGDLAVRDIPARWNERFEQLLGLAVPDDRRGCLQDVHWSHGSFGYFCTYSLGNLNAAQLMATARQQLRGLESELALGSYSTLLGWLRENVHQHGRRYLPQDLMRAATGSPTGISAHLAHLRGKYLS
jgi:carboxypeptidase Taq